MSNAFVRHIRTYELVPMRSRNSCAGCVAEDDSALCRKLPQCHDGIWKCIEEYIDKEPE